VLAGRASVKPGMRRDLTGFGGIRQLDRQRHGKEHGLDRRAGTSSIDAGDLLGILDDPAVAARGRRTASAQRERAG
jgi:hypothetical protein